MAQRVRFPGHIEPLVQFVEETTPDRIVAETHEKLVAGTPVKDMLLASALAVVRFVAGAARPTVVNLISFGFRFGPPRSADLLFDVRFLPNPHFVPSLRPHTGRDRKVRRFLDKSEATADFLRHTTNLLKFLIPQYVKEGKSYLTIGIGCTGGRHRSVAIAEALKQGLSEIEGIQLRVAHRDIAID